MKKHISWEVYGISYGQATTISGADIVDVKDFDLDEYISLGVVPTVDSYDLENYGDEGLALNFQQARDSLDLISDWKVIKICSVNDIEKTYSLKITTPYFRNLGSAVLIASKFKEQYPLLELFSLTTLKIEHLHGGPGCLFTFKTGIAIEELYADQIVSANDSAKHTQSEFSSSPFVVKEIKTLSEINGKTVVLEGDHDFGGNYPEMFKYLNAAHIQVDGIGNLYKDPSGLKNIIGYDNLIIQTTGFNADGLKMLIGAFKALHFVPKRVFFLLETIYINDPMFNDVEFYTIDVGDFTVARM